jgi:hypothetical protein
VLRRLAANRAFDKLEAGSMGQMQWMDADGCREMGCRYLHDGLLKCLLEAVCFAVVMIVMIRKIRRKRKDLSVGCLFVEQASWHANGGARARVA